MLVMANSLIGTPVLSMRASARVASLGTPVIDPESLKIIAFYLNGSRSDKILDARSIREYSSYGRDIDDYFGLETLKLIVNQPYAVTGTEGKFDIIANVQGGGISGQAGAIRHGLSRALLQADPNYRAALKSAGLLRRDPRMKERKKYGLKAARRAPQFSKR